MFERPGAAARRAGMAVLAALACSLTVPGVAGAALGDLDPGYGTNGVAPTSGLVMTPQDGLVDSAGRVVMAGIATNGQGLPVATLARIAEDGKGLDKTFNGNGLVMLPDQAATVRVALAPDGSLIVAGSVGDPAHPYVRRVSATGEVDGPYGGEFFYGEAQTVQDVYVNLSGQVLVSGWYSPVSASDRFFLAAYTSSGQQDFFFGSEGFVTASDDSGTNWRAHTMAVDGAGRIVLAGETGTAGVPVARFDSGGTLDPGFGSAGTPGMTTVGGSAGGDRALGSTAQGDRIVLVGVAGGSPFAARLDAGGVADPGFGSGGLATFGGFGLRPAFNAVTPDGTGALYVAGNADDESAVLARIDDRGVLEPQLGAAGPRPGTVTVNTADGPETAVGVAVDASGRPQLLGRADPTSGSRTILATRHLPNAPPVAAFTAPATLTPGQVATFDAAASVDPERQLRRFQWDFDGDGTFETDAGTQPAITRSFTAEGTVSVGLRITDAAGLQAVASRTLLIKALSPAQLVPSLGVAALLTPVRGIVKVRLPGSDRFVDLTEIEVIPNGTEIDARKGRVRLTVARDETGATDSALFYLGRFVFRQGDGPRPLTTLSLSGGNFRGCGTANPKLRVKVATAAAKKKRKRRIRRLFGDGEGRFRTKGRYAAATVRGTKWQTIDRCDGSRLRVYRGSVSWRDLLRGTRSRGISAGDTAFVNGPKGGGR